MRLLLLLAVSLIGTATFAAHHKEGNALSAALSTAWKHQTIFPLKKNQDITIVYGGQDISSRPTLA